MKDLNHIGVLTSKGKQTSYLKYCQNTRLKNSRSLRIQTKSISSL